MPTYQYKCENGHDFETFQSMADAPIEFCPDCGGRAERQISGGSGLIFKGSGFYVTDYVKKSHGTDSSSSNSPESSASKSAADSHASKSEKKGTSE